MAISEEARADLYTGLSEVLGVDRAETLMSAIPLHDLDEVATKGDLAVLRAGLKEDMAGLRVEIAQVRADLTAEIGALRKTMTTWMLTIMVSIIGAMSGIAFLT